MVWVVLSIGSLATIECLATLVSPKLTRKIIDYISIGSRLYIPAFLRASLGIMLLILAPRAGLWCYVAAIGLISTTSGLSVFFFALRRTKKILARIRNQSDLMLRIYAFLGLAMWVFLFYALTEFIPNLGPR